MGLDLYAGPLTRYYTHNWKTVVQQWAEENGFGFQRITPNGAEDVEEEESPEKIQSFVTWWQSQVLNALSQPRQTPYAPWPEDNEHPYFTDKPDWDALGAMLLVGACHVYGEPVPPTVEKNWDYTTHPLIERLSQDQERVWSLFRGASWWLPLPDAILFQGLIPTEDRVIMGTTTGLRWELEKLNDMAWQADEETILSWSRTEGYPVEGQVGPGGVFTKADIPEQAQYDTQSLAKFAFSIFYRALLFAEEHRTPILMDY